MELAFEGFARGVEPGRGARPAEPVRRYSRPQGRCEGVFWRPFKPRDVARYLTAAERFERAGKKPGDRCGPLGTVAIEVLIPSLSKGEAARKLNGDNKRPRERCDGGA